MKKRTFEELKREKRCLEEILEDQGGRIYNPETALKVQKIERAIDHFWEAPTLEEREKRKGAPAEDWTSDSDESVSSFEPEKSAEFERAQQELYEAGRPKREAEQRLAEDRESMVINDADVATPEIWQKKRAERNAELDRQMQELEARIE